MEPFVVLWRNFKLVCKLEAQYKQVAQPIPRVTIFEGIVVVVGLLEGVTFATVKDFVMFCWLTKYQCLYPKHAFPGLVS